jgi:hypothetical protein
MNTPRDIIARAIANGLLHECNCADDGEADKICDCAQVAGSGKMRPSHPRLASAEK